MISPSYLMYFLWHAVSLESFSSSHSTTTISHLPREKLLQLRVSLAPLEEQTRIVAELTASMASVEKARLAAQQQLHMVQALPAALLREVFASAEA